MRALVISSVYPSASQPGFGLFVRERVRHVARQCDVRVVAPVPWFPLNRRLRGAQRSGSAAVECHDGITVYYPRFFSVPKIAKSADGLSYFLRLLPFVSALRHEYPFDVIDAHFAYPDGFAAVLLGKVFKRPTLVTLRGDEARLADLTLRRLQMRFALRAARVIAVSDSLRQVAARIGIDAGRVRVIANGVDASLFRPLDRQTARAQLGLPHDRTVLLSAGALIERKGHHRVLEFLPELVRQRPDILFVIVGGEVPGTGKSYRTLIEQQVEATGLHDHVRLVPAQPHATMPLWMAAADLFCLATRWEGWCNALMEALACGVPVVTTRVGGNAEFVSNGENGILVPYWDGPAFAHAIATALSTPWDRDAIAARAAQHDWNLVADQVMEEFRSAEAETHRAATLGPSQMHRSRLP